MSDMDDRDLYGPDEFEPHDERELDDSESDWLSDGYDDE